MNQDIKDYIEKWIFRANEDFAVCQHLASVNIEQYSSTICFHAHQAVEKYLKAFLTYKGVDFPRTHDLDYLLAECSSVDNNSFNDIDLKELSEFGVIIRYPDDFFIPSHSETNYFVELTRHLKEVVERLICF
ncbi:HEPN domain-containing protein [Perlabentimonas gracilis]|uniref:HEPN domain-containing protein n=1 Tax=Perlabentimonas gracilis TaxID=2715279 RepID=UPI00140ACDBD|nr:HEPN domain-containing protein [Perlabentimonas gracilis]NHB68445.1 HEPN domain-containing protein [Perlabentimonas gracilis]